MSKNYGTLLITACIHGQSKLQAIAELFLLGSNIWPVLHDEAYAYSYSKCKDVILTRTKGLLVLIARLPNLMISSFDTACDLYNAVQDMVELVVGLTELCAHAGYLVGHCFLNCKREIPGVIIPNLVARTAIDLRMTCQLFKYSSQEHLTPQALVDMSTSLNKSLSSLSQCYMSASDHPSVCPSDQEQFKSCVKCFSSAGSSVITSIKCYKASSVASDQAVYHNRCVSFCQALVSTVDAAVNFATEETFIGTPASFTEAANDARRNILSACMNLVSCCVQLCDIIHDLWLNPSDNTTNNRMSRCIQCISRSTDLLANALGQSNINDVESSHNFSTSSQQSSQSHHHHNVASSNLRL